VYPFRIRLEKKIRPGGTTGVARGFINFGLKFTGRRVISLAIFRILLRRSARSRDFSQRWTVRPAKLAAIQNNVNRNAASVSAVFIGEEKFDIMSDIVEKESKYDDRENRSRENRPELFRSKARDDTPGALIPSALITRCVIHVSGNVQGKTSTRRFASRDY